jgi:hypothetical protein
VSNLFSTASTKKAKIRTLWILFRFHLKMVCGEKNVNFNFLFNVTIALCFALYFCCFSRSTRYRRVIWKLGRDVFITHFWTSGVGTNIAMHCRHAQCRVFLFSIHEVSQFYGYFCRFSRMFFFLVNDAAYIAYEDTTSSHNITILTQHSKRSRLKMYTQHEWLNELW